MIRSSQLTSRQSVMQVSSWSKLGVVAVDVGEKLSWVTTDYLLSDLIGIVMQYLFAQEHCWAPIGKWCAQCNSIQRPSNQFCCCNCYNWRFQHTCSIYTISEAPTCWRLKFSSSEEFWFGVMSSQARIYSNRYSFQDSLSEEQRDCLVIGGCGIIDLNGQRIDCISPLSTNTIELHCDPRSKTIFIVNKHQIILIDHIPFDLTFAKPIIQFDSKMGHNATIHSCHDHDASHICPIKQSSSNIIQRITINPSLIQKIGD